MDAMAKVALALHYIHQQGMLHQNISSSHVHYHQNSNQIKLDINHKKWCEQKNKQQVTCEKFYLSPEVAGGEAEYGQQAEVWAFGALLLEAVALKPKPKEKRDQQPLKADQIAALEHH